MNKFRGLEYKILYIHVKQNIYLFDKSYHL